MHLDDRHSKISVDGDCGPRPRRGRGTTMEEVKRREDEDPMSCRRGISGFNSQISL